MGGVSSRVRYNTEIATLYAYSGNSNEFNIEDINKNFLSENVYDFQNTMLQTKDFLKPVYDEKLFKIFYLAAYKTKKALNINEVMTKWVAGDNNASLSPADVEFIGSEYSGVSVKDKGGITLSNLSPKTLGIKTKTGVDIIYQFSNIDDRNMFAMMKRRVFVNLLNKVEIEGLVTPRVHRYRIEYDMTRSIYIISYKHGKQIELSRSEILDESNFVKNKLWHRVFGDYLVQNKQTYNKQLSLLYTTVSKNLIEIIKKTLNNHDDLLKILNISEKKYIYQTPNSSWVVPSAKTLIDAGAKVDSIEIASGDFSSGVLFKLKMKTNKSMEKSSLDLYIRYANGVYAANPTVRVQSLRNVSGLEWEKIT